MTMYQHRMYDLLGCSSTMLRSVEAGLAALVQAAEKAGATVVQSFSTSFPSGGYSCGVLLKESHMSLHTWPERGYCAADIFLCSGDLQRAEDVLIALSKATSIKRQTVSRGPDDDTGTPQWVHSRTEDGYYEAYQVLRQYYSYKSPYQEVAIVEHPKHGKLLLIDGDVQLATADERLYHELLVHPAVLSHGNVRTAVIIGGGDGGALREVLKHERVESVVLVDLDGAVIDAVKEWMPEVPGNAFTDSRVEVQIADAADWKPRDQCDALIIDLTAPRGVSVGAYKRLAESVLDIVRPDGVVAMHSGWWRSGRFTDVPSEIASRFRSCLIYDVWLDSFRCFWSFVVCWNARYTTGEALNRIVSNARTVPLTTLDLDEYCATALGRSREDNR